MMNEQFTCVKTVIIYCYNIKSIHISLKNNINKISLFLFKLFYRIIILVCIRRRSMST